MNKTNFELDKDIKIYGNEHNVPITKDDTLCFLLETINKNNCKQILEIGTAIGFGSIAIAENTICDHIDTVEIDENRFKIANNNIKNKGLENKINTNLIDAKQFLETCNKKYDLVYLDGPKGQYIKYLPMIVNVLNKNGIIFADNLNFHGMVTGETPITKGCKTMIRNLHLYIDEVTNNPNYETQIFINIGDGVGVTKLK